MWSIGPPKPPSPSYKPGIRHAEISPKYLFRNNFKNLFWVTGWSVTGRNMLIRIIKMYVCLHHSLSNVFLFVCVLWIESKGCVTKKKLKNVINFYFSVSKTSVYPELKYLKLRLLIAIPDPSNKSYLKNTPRSYNWG